MQKLLHFIKYHNAVPIIFSLISIATVSALAASPEVRDAFVSSQDVVRSVDNSGVVSADFNNFNFGLQIKEVTEDEGNYYVVYTYKTMGIQDYVWQEVQKENTLTVSKEVLGDRDLGLYVAEELGEVIDYQLSYLEEVQQIEEKNGLTQKIVATQYAGLIGRFLSPEEKVFPGYQSVVQLEEMASQPQIVGEFTPAPSSTETSQGGASSEENLASPQPVVQQMPVDRELIRQIVQEMLAQQQEQATSSISESIPTSGSTPETTSTTSEPEATSTEQAATSTPENATSTLEIATSTAETATSTSETATSTSETATSTEPVCTPNWSCSDWQPAPETQTCGQTFTQTRTCTDSSNCGTNEAKPMESQDATGNLCSAQNATGTCQADGTCSFTCADGFSNCDNDWSNGCETQGECQIPPQTETP